MYSFRECRCGYRYLYSMSEPEKYIRGGGASCHCSKDCCRQFDCPAAAKKAWRLGKERERERTCVVCRRPASMFQRFAPCVEPIDDEENPGCKGAYYFHTKQLWIYQCGESPEFEARYHSPDAKPRIHHKYCSLLCYNSSEYGHAVKEREGRRRRTRRWKRSHTGGGRMPVKERLLTSWDEGHDHTRPS